MNSKEQGLFLFPEWVDLLEKLPAKTAMTIIHNIYEYRRNGTEPPKIRGTGDIVQNIILAGVKRSQQAAENGRRGAQARWEESVRYRDKVLEDAMNGIPPTIGSGFPRKRFSDFKDK